MKNIHINREILAEIIIITPATYLEMNFNEANGNLRTKGTAV